MLLRRVLGPMTIVCVGVGGAIGSGVFATPGEAAKYLASPWAILLVWVVCGGITLMQALVTAELATRFPKAGGEYQYLKEAYGDFAAFFFGWSFTVFIVGAGSATIAAALGEFAAELLGLEREWSPRVLGCLAIVAVTTVNAFGVKTGAFAQNLLTVVKTSALLAIAAGALYVGGELLPVTGQVEMAQPRVERSLIQAFLMALLPVFWAYTGATDSAKLAEEVRDVHRALPRALIGTTVVLTFVYVSYNYALLCAVSPDRMAGVRSVPAMVFGGVHGWPVAKLILVASILICLGSISSVFLANVRVIYALARDRLTFQVLGRMSRRQAPVPALVVAGTISCTFVLNRSFGQMLGIYFLASTVLFGLTYASLIVFRLRDRRQNRPFPAEAYRAPAGYLLVAALLVLEIAIATTIIKSDIEAGSPDSLITVGVLVATAGLYFLWKRREMFDWLWRSRNRSAIAGLILIGASWLLGGQLAHGGDAVGSRLQTLGQLITIVGFIGGILVIGHGFFANRGGSAKPPPSEADRR